MFNHYIPMPLLCILCIDGLVRGSGVVAAVLCWAIDMRSGFCRLMHLWSMNIHNHTCSRTFVVGVHARISIYLWLSICTCTYKFVYVCISYIYICMYMNCWTCAYVYLHISLINGIFYLTLLCWNMCTLVRDFRIIWERILPMSRSRIEMLIRIMCIRLIFVFYMYIWYYIT